WSIERALAGQLCCPRCRNIGGQMLLLEIAAGVVIGVLVLAYLREIWAVGAGFMIAGAGLTLVFAAISAGWAGLLVLIALVAPIGGAVYLHKRRHPEQWISPLDEEAASAPRAHVSLCRGGRKLQ